MPTPRIHFDVPEHGWLPVRLELGAEPVQFAASDVDDECLPNLLRALIALSAGTSTSCWWFLEPDLVEFRFETKDGQVDFTITLWNGGAMQPLPGTDRAWSQWSGSRELLVAAFEGALAMLEPVLPPEPHWPLPFPSTLLRELQKRIRSEHP